MKFPIALLLASLSMLHAAAPDLSKITSRADLDAVITATSDSALASASLSSSPRRSSSSCVARKAAP